MHADAVDEVLGEAGPGRRLLGGRCGSPACRLGDPGFVADESQRFVVWPPAIVWIDESTQRLRDPLTVQLLVSVQSASSL
jgi:hypothetical protein